MTGTDDISHNEGIVSVYPNPARDIINIEVEGMTDTKISAVLYNSSMLQIDQVEFTSTGDMHKEELNIDRLPSGLYFLQLKWDDHYTMKKIVKL